MARVFKAHVYDSVSTLSRRRRRIKYTFFRLWVLQALFGNIEHMHSNACLLRSLEDQKRMCIELQTNAALYQSNIAELQASIVQLKGKLMEKQDELIQLHDSTQTTRFSIHQAAQNLERVQGMLDAVKTIHPGTIERIETMYKDNSPLVQDIHDLIILHAAKRRELLFEIELDQTESELRIASKKNDSQDDQMLLYRVKWVLSRLDLGMHKQNKCDYNTGMNGHCVDTFNMMCALFEFIRNGDTASLEPESNPKHYGKVQSNRGVGYTLQRNDFNCHVVCRSDVVDGSDTWDSFLQLLINKFVPNNMLAVRERLARRTAKLDAEANEAKAGLHLHHLYRKR
ncbi:uncharacterized protein PHALS_08672 [Plasmopara halstedii]|uniref:Uncharacterized protein n=1 Tax=Plasmopara halstedii TaxID=4781 RepID=A0A0P1ADN8_PLAHL|nr:uncharacterized protein PHALS_08672 [Plasmopara halstedii]CEG38609.1 hypothetical protein PHALS_08672 [Plasmopara halstedii]|eukprot:XP_024574978.1 hypothetical protein PHALS_08672 [Plasmopara halstedii]